jgi:hypothetical protein
MAQEEVSGEWPVRFTAQSTRTIFRLFAVFWWVGSPLLVAGEYLSPCMWVLAASLTIAAVVFSYMLLYRSWLLLQGHGARTTPGRAVGFCFIPVFFFYWWFVAYAGLESTAQ